MSSLLFLLQVMYSTTVTDEDSGLGMTADEDSNGNGSICDAKLSRDRHSGQGCAASPSMQDRISHVKHKLILSVSGDVISDYSQQKSEYFLF